MSLSFYVISSQREFSNRKNSGVREEGSDVNKSLCENILFVSLRLCTSPLVCAPPQLTLFTSPTTPSTPRHICSRQFSTLEILQSPDKFTGKRKTQIYVYVYISPSLADELLHSKEDKDTSGTADTDPKQRQAELTISFRGRKVLLSVKSVVARGVKEDGGGVAVDSPSIHRFIDHLIDPIN